MHEDKLTRADVQGVLDQLQKVGSDEESGSESASADHAPLNLPGHDVDHYIEANPKIKNSMNNYEEIVVFFSPKMTKETRLGSISFLISDILRWKADALPAHERRHADHLRWVASEFFSCYEAGGVLAHEINEVDLDDIETLEEAEAADRELWDLRKRIDAKIEELAQKPMTEETFGLVDARYEIQDRLTKLRKIEAEIRAEGAGDSRQDANCSRQAPGGAPLA
ncbi:hypothetical protein OHD62_19520 [Mesorhizobium sp. YC-39]|uniref:hypothetical protein n=1 Tax=unclassified Mesorhizobium TaxID=325217 RepID=UPI0021E75D3B|nr:MULTISPECIES: hypothetical protein [unclassified Mesorhizobium]MCV3210034.1 hypothetical protein [Mesorhizobium sp. YC-2]MCV3230564.1 hypothetical protein [Mesorhizobium sp. YC-39]